MRGADAVCSQYRRRNGVALRFQVSTNKVEPAESNSRMRLLSKEDWRPALPDEGIPVRPEVTIIIKPLAFARFREGWTWAASGPDFFISPSGSVESKIPERSPREPMYTSESGDIASSNIDN
jgi:hypothetical protein